MLFLLDPKQACTGKTHHKRSLGDVWDTREKLRKHLAPLVGGGQFLMINRSFTDGRFERRRRNVEKEAST